MGLFLKTGYMYKNQNNLNLDSSFLSDTEYNRITNLRDLYYSQGKRNWRVHIFPVTYCKRQEVFKLKLADSAGVRPKGYHIPSRMAWPSWKEQIVWWSCSWLSPFPSCPGGRGRCVWLTFRQVPPMWTRLDGWWGTVRACRYILSVGSPLLSATLNALRESAFYLHEENLIMTDR